MSPSPVRPPQARRFALALRAALTALATSGALVVIALLRGSLFSA